MGSVQQRALGARKANCVDCGRVAFSLRCLDCSRRYLGQKHAEGATRRFFERFDEDPETGCWLWTGASANGYGRFMLRRRQTLAHRFSYEYFIGPIPEGLQIDHLCRTRGCVNPGHLEPVTPQENTLRGDTLPAANARKTHCPKGHPYDAENTVTSSLGRRTCRACNRAKARRHYWKKRGVVVS